MQTKSFIETYKIIAIVRGVEKGKIVETARALYEGGINLIEVTFNQADPERQSDTTDSIKMIYDALGDRVCVGAGTVMSLRQVNAAFDAGAKYILSPNFDSEIVGEAKRLGALSIPGAMTPSEVANAYKAGADLVKVFPVSQLGVQYIKAMRAPMSHIPLIAVGGVNDGNIEDFFAAGAVGVGVGSNLVDNNYIKNEKWDELSRHASKYAGKR